LIPKLLETLLIYQVLYHEFHIPSVPFTFETLWIVLPYSLLLAGIGLVETLTHCPDG